MKDKNKEKSTPSYLDFDIAKYAWKPDVNYQRAPYQYRVGKGEQGVLICEPYKSIIGPHWRFKTPEVAEKSATDIYKLFNDFLEKDDFVGADLARKYLQMGYTRSRRYANYKGGKKYDKENHYQPLARGTGDAEKALSASIFYTYWKMAEKNPVYHSKKMEWKAKYG